MNTYMHTDNKDEIQSKDSSEVVGGLFSKYDLSKFKVNKKPLYEYQELCKELEPIYGKAIWTLPFKAGFTEYKIRKAHEIANSRNILEVRYLIGIIKRLS